MRWRKVNKYIKYVSDTFDIKLSNDWNYTLTKLYKVDKISAERWRYRYFPSFFDNDTGEAGFDSIWIPDPIDIFDKVGKHRVNYKRIDNPFYTDVSLTSAFHDYRYWSTHYDYATQRDN